MRTLRLLMFHQPGPTFATAKIALTDESSALPEKDGAVIARRFKEIFNRAFK